eukprot:CAMPEP_0204918048 /NCGR_PEP_ID=MMETSP1397-20131031/15787_1 /ASSEMBLY_ACC=CAM_ASM_000891 /TAXON_ID=49980 /ORGANISM="Climacostomum Climacostomum virens, Strain Stock W-24" /LENGTH=307 /DNA_ID=CAMNT_0052091139 /DNA_START=277 /DNA_END=1197 /DNA_ORIENTATION=-
MRDKKSVNLKIGELSRILNSVTHCSYKSVQGHTGRRHSKPNQDSYLIAPQVFKLKGIYLFAVADGHGSNGHSVSGFIKENLLPAFTESYKSASHLIGDDSVVVEAYKLAFKRLQSGLENENFDVSYSGSTLISVFIRGSSLFCANVGDSRAVLGKYSGVRWSAVALSRDHKPNEADEAERIFRANGIVQKYISRSGEAIGPYRVWSSDDASPGLAMSRSLGDRVAQTYGVSCDPEIMQIDLEPNDRFVILGSDGLWEHVKNQEAVDIVKNRMEKRQFEESANDLVKVAIERWQANSDRQDDITVIVI